MIANHIITSVFKFMMQRYMSLVPRRGTCGKSRDNRYICEDIEE